MIPDDRDATPLRPGRGRDRRASAAPAVTLAEVDDDVLEQLVRAATTDASPDEVTPPLTPGDAWSAPRVEWLRRYHRDRRSGVDGPHGEATRAVVVGTEVVGAVRWARTTEPGTSEIGIWLRRSARGRGVAPIAVAAAVRGATAAGARVVVARTTAANTAALGALRSAGFEVEPADPDGGVRATWRVSDGPDRPAGPGR